MTRNLIMQFSSAFTLETALNKNEKNKKNCASIFLTGFTQPVHDQSTSKNFTIFFFFNFYYDGYYCYCYIILV